MKRPSLQTTVSVVEIVASLAVVVSLLYVAYEFKRSETLNSRDVESTIYQRMLERDRLVIENPELAEILVKAAGDPDGLSSTDRVRFLAYEHIFYDSWESAWYYYHEGILEESAWESWDTWFVADAKRRPLLGWTGNRSNFSDGFLEHADRALKVGSAGGDETGE